MIYICLIYNLYIFLLLLMDLALSPLRLFRINLNYESYRELLGLLVEGSARLKATDPL
jgi:hypothetical protein